jgi:hypothetical protein
MSRHLNGLSFESIDLRYVRLRLSPALDEMALLQNRTGMKPVDVPYAATVVGARNIRREDEMGTIEKHANLVFISRDPLCRSLPFRCSYDEAGKRVIGGRTLFPFHRKKHGVSISSRWQHCAGGKFTPGAASSIFESPHRTAPIPCS